MSKNFFMFVLFIFLVGSVCALSVTPGRTTLNFEPGLRRTINFEIFNSEGRDMKLNGSVVPGELSQYINLSLKEMFISADEKSKKFSYDIELPGNLSPGLHKGEILIMEVPSGQSLGSTQVIATLAVVTQIYVYVPYPGKYADAKMVVYNANQGEDVLFVFPVVSAGEFDLTSVYANVELFNKMGEQVDNFETQTIGVLSGEKKEIVYRWKADVPIGNYRAVAGLVYDEGVINFEELFAVGSKELQLKDIKARNFELGEIAKIEMLIENKWSEPISGAYIETKIKNERGDVVSSFQSPSQNIEALSQELFNSYWDTAGVSVGTYETEVSVNYADKSSKSNLKFKVDKNELTIFGLGYVVSTDSGKGTNKILFFLIVIIVLLVLTNLLWFFLLRKKLKKKSKP